jgi:DNA-binding IscR family transcriptional regulator
MRIGRESAYAIEGLLALAAKPRGAVMLLVKEIFIAIEGPEVFNHCILGSDRCADTNPCALHSRWKQARQRIVDELMERTTLADLARGDNPLHEIREASTA